MPNIPLRLVTRNYDMITPLLVGDVTAEGVDLDIDRETPIHRFREDESFQAGEMSFAQYLRRLSTGEADIVGVPVFLMRGFRQRCFFIRRDSDIHALPDLSGRRVGTNGWPDTGNTWSRALLREADVDIGTIQWSVGTIDGVTDQIFGHQVTAPNLPSNAELIPEGTTLVDLLVAGDLDALMVPWPPRVFYEPASPIVRLFRNYHEVEQDYASRVGYYPAHHLLGVRARVVEEHPWILPNLFNAFEESRKLAEERRMLLADTAPWLLEELEDVREILGPNWQAHGVAVNRTMTAALCEEIHAQGIIDRPVDPSEVFARFEQACGA